VSERSRGSKCATVPIFLTIGLFAADIWRFFDFPRWRLSPPWTCDACVWTTHEGHLAVCITGQNLIGINTCSSFDNIQILIFCEIGFKMPIYAPSPPQKKIGSSRKSRPKFAKIGKDLLHTNTRNHAKVQRCRPKGVREKRYNYFTSSTILVSRGTTEPQFTSLGGDV